MVNEKFYQPRENKNWTEKGSPAMEVLTQPSAVSDEKLTGIRRTKEWTKERVRGLHEVQKESHTNHVAMLLKPVRGDKEDEPFREEGEASWEGGRKKTVMRQMG